MVVGREVLVEDRRVGGLRLTPEEVGHEHPLGDHEDETQQQAADADDDRQLQAEQRRRVVLARLAQETKAFTKTNMPPKPANGTSPTKTKRRQDLEQLAAEVDAEARPVKP